MADSRETLTKRAFVAGYPIHHSRSPLIHNFWIDTSGIDGHYSAVAVAPEGFADFIAMVKQGGDGAYCGGNVTIPHKESAYRLADRPDRLAEELGAANTVWLEEGRLHASNTDGFGFVANLDEHIPGWQTASKAVVLGAGGASRAVIQALRDRGIGEINVVNRTVERAIELSDRFGAAVHAHGMPALAEVMQGADLFVNTTSLGMDGAPAPTIDFTMMCPGAIVTDIVYVPLKTPILLMAERQGLRTVDGLGMLLHQARPGFERWFGRQPVVTEELRALIIDDMARHP